LPLVLGYFLRTGNELPQQDTLHPLTWPLRWACTWSIWQGGVWLVLFLIRVKRCSHLYLWIGFL